MAKKPQALLPRLTRSGPHQVARGDLASSGIPGIIYSPTVGTSLPTLVFAHDWMTHPRRYHRTLRHLASWGFLVAAPSSGREFFSSEKEFSEDLTQTIEFLGQARFLDGRIHANPRKLGYVGHGFGASVAVRSAVAYPEISALAALWPSKTSSSTLHAAQQITAPGFLLATVAEELSLTSNAAELAMDWGGDVTLRAIPKFDPSRLPERRGPRGWLEFDVFSPRAAVHGLLTGWLLATVAKEKGYIAFADPEAELPGVAPLDASSVQRNMLESLRTLLT